MLRSFPKANFEDDSHPWLSKLQKGLNDILFSKIGKSQRDPALILVAAVIEVSDFEWCLADTELGETDGNGNSRYYQKGSISSRFEDTLYFTICRFFQIVCNLACIEIIMQLEDKQLEVSAWNLIEHSIAGVKTHKHMINVSGRGVGQF